MSMFHSMCSLNQWERICGGRSFHHQACGSNSVFDLFPSTHYFWIASLRDLQVPPSLNTLILAESVPSSDNDEPEEARMASPALDVLEDASDSPSTGSSRSEAVEAQKVSHIPS